jgi:hypothetical protein
LARGPRGRLFAPHNLEGETPEELWAKYIQLTEAEAAFRPARATKNNVVISRQEHNTALADRHPRENIAMIRRQFLKTSSFLLGFAKLPIVRAQNTNTTETPSWLTQFATPPDAAYPWVYSFWMEGNISKEGITADLEGMKQAGIRGLLFMDGSLGNPAGPHRFMSESWLEMFSHMLAEADRLGIEVNLNNDPGWAGSGGPWVTPQHATQKVIVAETFVEGPNHFAATLARPAGINHDFYGDIAVIAYPVVAGKSAFNYRIPVINTTKSFAGGGDFAGVVPWPRFIPTNSEWPAVDPYECVESAKMLDLTGKLGSGGELSWDVPPGRWVVFRFGHTVSNGATREAQEEAKGLECDKMSKAAVEAHFNAMVGKITERAGPLAGKVLVSAHIDSWEAGSGNWTTGFREEFHHRRSYDLLPCMPVLAGIVVDSREVSERFLWDFRETACQLLLENYAGHFRELANRKGLRLSIEAYDGTCDDLRYAGRADEPMTEFWRSIYSGLPLSDLSEGMASAAHIYGKQILGAEAFTSARGDFLDHPATLKPMADWAFCTGVNRLCFSEWIMQPWPRLVPGVSFLTIGTVFHRNLTWWEQAKPWHEYIARCQHMLRVGQFVADICFVVPEGGPYRFTPPIPADQRGGIPDRPEYNFDGCPSELVPKMKVQNGMVVLPSGMAYRLLVLPTYNANGRPVMRLMDSDDYLYKPMPLPKVQTMTPDLLREIKRLIEAGATVLGNRPLKSPSLVQFPECDNELNRLADEIWGEGAGATGMGEHRCGKGRVVWVATPEQVFAGMGVPPDFACEPDLKGKLNYTHRRASDGTEIYFVANQQAGPLQGTVVFRVEGKRPDLYWPESGASQQLSTFEEKNGVMRVPLSLNARESVFVIFRAAGNAPKRITAITCDGETVWPRLAAQAENDADDSFIMAAWIGPGPDIPLPKEVGESLTYEQHRDLMAAGFGYQTFASPGQGLGGFAIGTNGIVVFQYGESGTVEPLLVYAKTITTAMLVGVIYKDRVPKLYLNGKLVKTGPVNPYPRYAKFGWGDHCHFAGEIAALQQFQEMLGPEAEGVCVSPAAMCDWPAFDFNRGDVWKSGRYTFKASDGESRELDIRLPAPQQITGPWEVEFDPKWGGPPHATFETLQDWSKHSDEGIKYYSGADTYRCQFNFAQPHRSNPNAKVYLDLGKVAVIAQVVLNGKELGTLWNPPHRVDVTRALADGENKLEVKVVDLWVNRSIGDEQLPEDSDRNPDGGLKAWPRWVLDGKGSPTGRYTFASRHVWTKDSPLIPSGLLGPVRLLMVEKMKIG